MVIHTGIKIKLQISMSHDHNHHHHGPVELTNVNRAFIIGILFNFLFVIIEISDEGKRIKKSCFFRGVKSAWHLK